MKRWLIMDFGQVLVRYEPKNITKRFVKNENDARQICEVVFDRLYWDRLDAGTISDGELIEAVKERLPKRLWELAEKTYLGWIDCLPEIEGMRELLIDLRDSYGLSLGLLSNISRGFADREDDIPILKLFNVRIYSAVVGCTKPSREIFKILCEACDMHPEEAVFVDDSQKNIDGAEAFGIKGVLFDGDVKKLKQALIEAIE